MKYKHSVACNLCRAIGVFPQDTDGILQCRERTFEAAYFGASGAEANIEKNERVNVG